MDDGGHRGRTGCVAHGCVPMAEGDAESRELPLCAPHAGYSDEEEAYTETKTERIQLFSKECLYREQEIRIMQGGMPTPDLSQIHKLLSKHAVPDDLVVVRSSSRAKRLIFKSSVKKGVEIVVPHGADSSWVAEMTENRPHGSKAPNNMSNKGGPNSIQHTST